MLRQIKVFGWVGVGPQTTAFDGNELLGSIQILCHTLRPFLEYLVNGFEIAFSSSTYLLSINTSDLSLAPPP